MSITIIFQTSFKPFWVVVRRYKNMLLTLLVKDPNWVQVMKDQIIILQENRMWDIVTLSSNKSAIGCKWVYQVKYHYDGSLERYKARLVAKGYTHRECMDFTETFSPVAKMITVRVILAMAVVNSWKIKQMDI